MTNQLTKSSVQLPEVENEQRVVFDEHEESDDDEDVNEERFSHKCRINSAAVLVEAVKKGN
jgi:hypothetical protein